MAWIESHQSLGTHHKTLALRRILQINRAEVIGHLHLLWWWCLDNAPDGDISTIHPDDLAEAMDWTGEGKALLDALISAGFVDPDGHIHDWDDFAGKLNDRREDNRRRQEEHRNRLRNNDKPNRNNDITVTSQLRNGATVPNSTVPNHIPPLIPPKGEKPPDGLKKVELPEWVDSKLWAEYLKMRQRIRKPVTDDGQRYLLKDLEKLKNAGQDVAAVIQQSIKRSYQGFFEVKDGGQHGQERDYRGVGATASAYTKPP